MYRSEDGPLVVLSSVPGRNRASAILGERNGDGYGFSGCATFACRILSRFSRIGHRPRAILDRSMITELAMYVYFVAQQLSSNT